MNPLTRLADGQVLGRDFQFFHGAGVALIHFPLFELFGGGLFGSEMSRWFTSLTLFCVSTMGFIYFWFRSQHHPRHLSVAIAAFALTLLVTARYAEVITPSNSLLGIRTTLPIMVGALILFRTSLLAKMVTISRIRAPLYPLLSGLLLAIAVIMGTEHGIDAVIAYTLVEATSAFLTRRRDNIAAHSLIKVIGKMLAPLGLALTSAGVSLAILASVISLGHPVALLRYALVTVPGDQFWYYGAEPQGYLELGTLFTQLGHHSMYPLYLATLLSAPLMYVAIRMRLFSADHWRSLGFLTTYGVLTLSSLLGYFFPTAQIHGALRVLILIDSLIIAQLLFSLWQKRGQNCIDSSGYRNTCHRDWLF